MKIVAVLLKFIIAALILSSCQKDFTDNRTVTTGSLVKDNSGNCAPISTGGSYITNNTLTNANYIEVQVNFDQPGNYIISSDTLNGYFFQGIGIVGTAGINNVRLQGVGNPVSIGNNNFTIKYGISTCNVIIQVTGSNAAVFTIGSPTGNCSTSTVAGTYTINTQLTVSNTITLQVNVNSIGSYNISTNIVNGMSFTKTGTFTNTGLQTVTLIGTGTPTVAGSNIFNVNSISGCSISVVVAPFTGSIFIAGSIGDKAVLWKDAVPTFLNTAANTRSEATDVTIVGNDVYILGDEFDTVTTDFRIIIWKNGLRSPVAIDTLYESTDPRNLVVQNNDVYFTYNRYQGNMPTVVLNKNGINTVLNHGIYQGAKAINLKIYQNDVYVSAKADSIWNAGGTTSYISKAIYWKNGQYFPLPYDRGEFNDADIDNSGNLFFVGSARLRINPANQFFYYDIASLFKNGNYNLFHGWSNNFIASHGDRTFVENITGEIYTGGIFHESSAPNTQGIQNLVYWKGTNMVRLTNYNPSLNLVNPLSFLDLFVKNNKVYSLVYDELNPSKQFYYEDNLQVNVLGVTNPNNFNLNKIFVR